MEEGQQDNTKLVFAREAENGMPIYLDAFGHEVVKMAKNLTEIDEVGVAKQRNQYVGGDGVIY